MTTTTSDLINKYNINKTTWTYKGFHGVLHTFFPVGETGPAMKEFFGDGSRITLFFVQNDYVHWYWNDEDLTRIRNEFFSRLKKDKNYLEKLKKEWKEKIKAFERVINKIEKTDFSILSNDELSKLYDEFYKKYVDEFKYFMVLGDAISMHADRYLVPEFEKILGKNFSTDFPQLITTKHASFIEEENKDRQKLLNIYKKDGKIRRELLEKHAKKYFYIQNNYAKAIHLTAENFENMLKEDFTRKEEQGKQKNMKEKAQEEKERLIQEYHLIDWNKTLLYVMDEFFGIQDTRKKYVLISNYYQFKFLQEAEKRTKIPLKALQYSVYPEFKKVLEKKINVSEFEERKKICVCINTGKNYEVIKGAEALNALEHLQKGDASKEIKGIVASQGKAKGRVKIILKIHDLINMEKGDILVASMTRPEMVTAMQQAAAIVTDEGGVTCHAAIVSRELRIPCIIGTKVATKVLKDGDLVEVDAEKGVVKKIS